MKSMFKKVTSFVGLSVVLALNFLLMSGAQVVHAQSGIGDVGEDCKWFYETCPTVSREVCLVDGTGNTCTCGNVTRECT